MHLWTRKRTRQKSHSCLAISLSQQLLHQLLREQRLELFLIRNKASDTVTEFVTDRVLIVSKQKFTVLKLLWPSCAMTRVCQPPG